MKEGNLGLVWGPHIVRKPDAPTLLLCHPHHIASTSCVAQESYLSSYCHNLMSARKAKGMKNTISSLQVQLLEIEHKYLFASH